MELTILLWGPPSKRLRYTLHTVCLMPVIGDIFRTKSSRDQNWCRPLYEGCSCVVLPADHLWDQNSKRSQLHTTEKHAVCYNNEHTVVGLLQVCDNTVTTNKCHSPMNLVIGQWSADKITSKSTRPWFRRLPLSTIPASI